MLVAISRSGVNLVTKAQSVITNGKWAVTLHIPSNAAIGTYQVESTCDEYTSSFSYPVVALRIALPCTSPGKASLTVASTVAAGSSPTVSGRGFGCGTNLTVNLASSTTKLTTVTTDQSGAFSTRVTIPSGLALGAHHIFVTNSAGTVLESDPIQVVASSGLANTGTPDGWLAAVGGLVLAVGAATMIGAKLRYSRPAS